MATRVVTVAPWGPAGAVGPLRLSSPYLLAGAAFLGSELVARWAGVRFDASPLSYFWQYLDEPVLRHDLVRGIASLHAQPPLFNLFLGCVLKLFPEHAAAVFAALYAPMSLGLLIAMTSLMRRLDVPPALAAALVVLFALHPAFVVYSHWLFYTLPVAILLVASALVLVRFCDTGSPRLAAAFAALAATVMFTRAAFHLLWFVAVLAAVGAVLERGRRRTLLAAAAVPVLLVVLWYGKVWWQVGVFGPSSWVGMSLAKGWDLPLDEMEALVASGAIPAVWVREPFMWPEHYRDLGYFARDHADGGVGNPALDAAYKSSGFPNFNHREYARISRDMLRGDLALMRIHPGRYLRRVAHAVAEFVQPGPTLFLVTYDSSRIRRLSEQVSTVLSPPLLLLGLPVLLAFGMTRAASAGGPRAARAALAYMAVTVLWLALCTNLLEIGENDRIRWEVDGLLVVLLGCAVASLRRSKVPA
jgi:hypothetical protein